MLRWIRSSSFVVTLVVVCQCGFAPYGCAADVKSDGDVDTAKRIDGFMAKHWSASKVKPAELCDDATFLRRLTLDLAGRIPTPPEVERFLADTSSDKRSREIQQILDGPEFSLHVGNVLDEMIQGSYAGNTDFIAYLRASVRDNKSWKQLFREMMLGPWKTKTQKPANRFLDKRARNLDRLTTDATRVFFGVDISCAKCHDHPLVEDWKQDHYYGMASFFNRTTGGKGTVGEKTEGEVKFAAADGSEKTANMMFLSGRVVSDSASKDAPVKDESQPDGAEKKPADKQDEQRKRISRRQRLVETVLENRTFFSRALVNQLWQYFHGRGLVYPVDQMHSQNTPAVPGLLEWLADDFSGNGYNIRRLIAAIVSTRVYQLSSQLPGDGEPPAADLFAVAGLRPLGRKQLAFSLLLATGSDSFQKTTESKRRTELYKEIEKRSLELTQTLDPRTADFQSSATEALFMANNEATQELVVAAADNFVSRLAKIEKTETLVDAAVLQIMSRRSSTSERAALTAWFDRQQQPREVTCSQLVWALLTSSEFRFNH